ncbi:hypothetical protein ABEV34_19295 [Methylorubrum rhodesianum]|uniref:hypothetical protein n=1 Tax=Methylorubrum TaxID=2282523 RepID=UPI00160E3E90|nr:MULTISPECIES: hypothetical protein [Methylorubrum]MBB5765653.1 hypothetical protein [Methylorubrum rhodesianum]MBI1691573.1 hypothetical protein [Methylorubrum sp. DB1722]
MGRYIDTIGALRLIAEGRRVPAGKYAALQRLALIRVRGHGCGSKVLISDAGRDLLQRSERHA